jgi:gliding motility-associated-like protein
MKTQIRILSSVIFTFLLCGALSAQTSCASTYTVTNVNDAGAGSLRQGIANAYTAGGTTFCPTATVTINFNIPAASGNVINLLSEINTTYTGNFPPNIIINGLNIATNSYNIILRGLGTQSINGFNFPSLSLTVNGLQFDNFASAIRYYRDPNNTTLSVGALNKGNVFTRNKYGINTNGGVVARYNYIGTDRNFTAGLGNDVGIYATTPTNRIVVFDIGGYDANPIIADTNYICSNNYGVWLDPPGTGDAFQPLLMMGYNIIGTNNATATRADLGNTYAIYGSTYSDTYLRGNTIAYTKNAQGLTFGFGEFANNSFYCNAGVPIFTFPNPLPTITQITPNQNGTTTISGTVPFSGSASPPQVINIFQKDAAACPTLPCQGFFVDTVLTNNATNTWLKTVPLKPGKIITANATATGANNGYYILGSTSLFAACATIPCPALSINLTQLTPVYCYGGNDGRAQVTLTPSGPGGVYQYQFVNNVTNAVLYSGTISATLTQSFINLTAGTYKVLITNTLTACSYTSNIVTITQPAAPLSITSCGQVQGVSTTTSSDAKAQVVIMGGTPGVTLTYTKQGSTAVFPSDICIASSPFSQCLFVITGLAPGTYNVTVTDNLYSNATAKAGCTATCQFVIPPLDCSAFRAVVQSVVPATCKGLSTGSVTIDYSQLSGIPYAPLTFTWSDGIVASTVAAPSVYTYTRTGMAAGIYSVTVRDFRGCSVNLSVTVTEPLLFSVTAKADSVRCFGETNGVVTLTTVNGAPPFSYSWSNPSIGNQPIATNLGVGSYVATVTDSRGCTATTGAVVSTPAVLATLVTPTNPTIIGGANGKIVVSVTGGTKSYVVDLTLNGTSIPLTSQLSAGIFVFNDLAPGTYTLTTTDAHGCSKTQTIVLTAPVCNLTISSGVTNVKCKGALTGSILINVSGNVGTTTYVWNPSVSTTNVATNLAPGIYSVTVTDSRPCSASKTMVVNEPSAPLTTVGTPTAVTTAGSLDGKIDVLVRGGTMPYTVVINTTTATFLTDSTFRFTGLASGTYTYNVTDANGCTTAQTVTVGTGNCNVTLGAEFTNVRCKGASTGDIALFTSGNVGTTTYTWDPSVSTTNFANNLVAGTYRVTVTDSRPCTVTKIVVITEPNAALTTVGTPIPITTVGASDGKIDVLVRGGTKLYSVVLNSTTATVLTDSTFRFTGLPTGNYTYTVTDANGCTTTQTVTVGTPNCNLTLTATTFAVLCKGTATGAIALAVTNAVGTTTFAWAAPITSTVASASNLRAGTYSATVTDSRGCTAATPATVTEPNLALSTVGTPTDVTTVGGSDGIIDVLVRGGRLPYTVLRGGIAATRLTDSTFRFTGLPVGTYTYTVIDQKLISDGNGCTVTQTVTIGGPICAININQQTINVLCKGASTGDIALFISGNVGTTTFAWVPSVSTTNRASNLAAGTYSVSITDARLCTATKSFVITEPNAALTSVGTATAVTTSGGTDGRIDVLVRGGVKLYTVAINATSATGLTDSTFRFSNLPTGNYTYTVTDANGCKTTQAVTVGTPNCNINVFSEMVNVKCKGASTGSILLALNGNVGTTTFAWTPSVSTTNTASNLAAGTYSVVVTDSRQCSASKTIVVTEPNAALTTVGTQTAVTTVGGSDGKIDILVRGGTKPYTVVRGAISATGLTDSTFNFSNLVTGNYTYVVTDANGCATTQTVTVGRPNCNLTLTASTIPVLCKGTSTGRVGLIVANAVGTPTFAWAAPITSTVAFANNLPAGTYSATVTDSRLCTASATATVTEPNQALSTVGTPTAVTVVGGSNGVIDVLIRGGILPYSVFRGAILATRLTDSTFRFTGLPSGTYTYTVVDQKIATDANGCVITQTVTVGAPNCAALSSVAIPTTVTTVGGSDGKINITVRGGTVPYTVTIGATVGTRLTDSTFVFSGLPSGLYTYVVASANGCTATQTVTIPNQTCTVLAVIQQGRPISCFNSADGELFVNLQNASNPQYRWLPDLGNTANPTGLRAGTYSVTVTSTNGCTATSLFVLTNPPEVVASFSTRDTFICRGQTARLSFSVTNVTNQNNLRIGIRDNFGNANEAFGQLFQAIAPTTTTTYGLTTVFVGSCRGRVLTDSIKVTVGDPSVLAGFRVEKDSLCAGTPIRLSVTAASSGQYIWQTPLGDQTTNVPQFVIPNTTSANTGDYSVKILQNTCTSIPTTPIRIRVFDIPTERANAGPDKTECELTTATLGAIPISGANLTGRWVALNSGVVANPSSPNSAVGNLSPGVNRFVWIMTSPACGETSRDTMVLSVSGKPDLDNVPQIDLDTKLTTGLINIRQLLKTKTGDPSVFDIKIVKAPDKMIVESRGNGIFFDRNNLVDAQIIEIEFQICSKFCPTVCNTGKLTIRLEAIITEDDFKVPKIFSTNRSSSTTLEINGLDFFIDNEITIVNRWGGVVFGPTLYKPDKSWDGKKNGAPLPTGAYYYYIRYRNKDILKTKKGIIYLVETL